MPWDVPLQALQGARALPPSRGQADVPACAHTLALWPREIPETIWTHEGSWQLDPWRRPLGMSSPLHGTREALP